MTDGTGGEGLWGDARRELFTAVVGDVMDAIGLHHQFLPPEVRALREDMVVLGRAMPVLEADVFGYGDDSRGDETMRRPFGLMLRALDDLKDGEVYLCTGAAPRYALWGELMTVRAVKLGAAGAVLDGYHRDTGGILAMDFPVFSFGAYAQDQGPRGKVVDFRVPVELGGVRISPGDVVFGDRDGVCVVPSDAEEEVLRRALEKVRVEGEVERAFRDGMGAEEAWETFGVM
jgi:regulator of RNase E activity RraA